MAGIMDNMRRRKLYKQWVQNAGLHAEDVPLEIRKEITTVNEEAEPLEDEPRGYSYRRAGYTLPIDIRQLLLIGAVFTALVVTISVLATVLVMQSC